MTDLEVAVNQSDFPEGKRLPQQVLPETMQIAVEANRTEIGERTAGLLLNRPWTGVEVRDISDLPNFNLIYSVDGNFDVDQTLDIVTKQMRQLRDLLGYTKDDLSSLRIIMDPDTSEYNHAFAFFNTKENNLWKKIHRGNSDLAHELGHWVTTGIVKDQKSFPTLLQEGIATWLAAQLEEDPHAVVDSHVESAKGFAEGIGLENINIDGEYHNVPAMFLGSHLVDVIVKNLDGDTIKFGNMLRNINQHDKVSNWLRSNGLSSSKIEDEWRSGVVRSGETSTNSDRGNGSLLNRIRRKN